MSLKSLYFCGALFWHSSIFSSVCSVLFQTDGVPNEHLLTKSFAKAKCELIDKMVIEECNAPISIFFGIRGSIAA